MPLIDVKVVEGVFSPDQKNNIIQRLSDAMVSVEGENMCGSLGAWSRKSKAGNEVSAVTR